jgi:uncharacterized protein (TIRG00374 family)
LKLWRNLLIGVVVSILFLWLALRDVNWAAVQGILDGAHWQYVPVIFAVWWGGLAARAARWYFLMGGRIRPRSVFHIHNIGFLINSTLPFRIGELARAYLISREPGGVSGLASLSSILTERILDVLALVVILIFILLALPLDTAVITGGLFIGGGAVLAFAILLVSVHSPSWIYKVLNVIVRIFPFIGRINSIGLLERILDGLQPLTSWRGLSRIGLWTIIAWVFGLFEVWSLALLFPDWPQTAVVRAGLALALVGASLSIVVPFTPAGVGPFEAAVIFALTSAGASHEIGVTYAVVWHTGLVLFYGLWGVIGLLAQGVSFGQVWRGTAIVGEDQLADTSGSSRL